MIQDFKFAVRRLFKNPGFTIFAVMVLALGIGVNTAVFNMAPGTKPATATDGLAFAASWNAVGEDYFATVGLPIQRGRGFSAGESIDPGSPAVTIVDDILAKKLWPGEDALGRYIQYASRNAPVAESDSGHVGLSNDVYEDVSPEERIQIVGIVPARRYALFETNPAGEVYVPFARGFQSNVFYFVRFGQLARAGETAAAELIRRTVRETDPVLPILSLRTFDQHLDANLELWLVRASTVLFSVFGVLAL